MKSPLSKRLGSRISQSDARSLSSIASKSGTSARISTDADMKLSWKVLRRDYVANQGKGVTEKGNTGSSDLVTGRSGELKTRSTVRWVYRRRPKGRRGGCEVGW